MKLEGHKKRLGEIAAERTRDNRIMGVLNSMVVGCNVGQVARS